MSIAITENIDMDIAEQRHDANTLDLLAQIITVFEKNSRSLRAALEG